MLFPIFERQGKSRKSSKAGFIDKTGAVRIPAEFEDCRAFSEGLAAVKLGSKWGYIVAPEFDIMYDPSSGRVVVWRGNRCGYIDLSGTLVISCKYRFVGTFSDGRAPAQREYRSGVGYIDLEGREVIKPRFRKGLDFTDGLAWVETDKTLGYCDTEGQMVWEGPWVETFR